MSATVTQAPDHGGRLRIGTEPGAALSVDELLQMIETGEIDMVLLAVPGVTGMLRGKQYDAAYFVGHALEHCAHAAAYLLTTDADMRMLPGFSLGGWEHGAGDILLRPDEATLRPCASYCG